VPKPCAGLVVANPEGTFVSDSLTHLEHVPQRLQTEAKLFPTPSAGVSAALSAFSERQEGCA